MQTLDKKHEIGIQYVDIRLKYNMWTLDKNTIC